MVAPASPASIAEFGDLLGRVGDVRVVLPEDVGAGDGAGDDHGVRVPAHASPFSRAVRSSSVIGRDLRALIGIPEDDPELGLDQRLCRSSSTIRSRVFTLDVPSSDTSHSTRTESELGVDLALERDRAAPDDVLVAADPRGVRERRRAPPRGRSGRRGGSRDRGRPGRASASAPGARSRAAPQLDAHGLAQPLVLADEVERIVAAVGREAASDHHSRV